jgi:hypothetical protein
MFLSQTILSASLTFLLGISVGTEIVKEKIATNAMADAQTKSLQD